MMSVRRLAIPAFLVLCLAQGDQALARDWQVLPETSRIVFEASQAGQTFEGAFESFEAEIAFDPERLEEARVVVTVDVASLETPDRSRTEQALSAMWLGALDHPRAQYEAQSFRRLDGDRYEVEAVLTTA